uniref:Uncharacterized protein n=1 Tax=Utricularia reniformis TaxID=192314 RepID=A0A1Y0B3F0_9LAMI|nr:hypothetical protein AEK19_MT1737 [Utricularia reniformis]ART31914.1 hypothetical protein AEK19_MT1737 [Utricularia reniformis]
MPYHMMGLVDVDKVELVIGCNLIQRSLPTKSLNLVG